MQLRGVELLFQAVAELADCFTLCELFVFGQETCDCDRSLFYLLYILALNQHC